MLIVQTSNVKPQSSKLKTQTSKFKVQRRKTDCLVLMTEAVCRKSILKFGNIKEDTPRKRKALLRDNAHLYQAATSQSFYLHSLGA